MEPYEKQTHGDYTVTVFYDPEPCDPREWSNVGTMVCGHRSYTLGDVQVRPGERWEAPDDAAIILPLGLIDHSGISMYVGGGAHPHDPGGWDSGTVGVIYMTRDTLNTDFGGDVEKGTEALELEVKTYDQYLRGDVYGFVVEKRVPCCETCHHEPDDELVDSCWGFFDPDDCMADGLHRVPADQRQVAA